MKSIIGARDYEYLEVRRLCEQLCSLYPFLSLRSVGRSVAGREIFCLTLGKSDEYVLYTAATHGSEHITSNIALAFLERVCEAIKNGDEIAGLDARRAFYGKGIMVVPLHNPDGCEIAVKGEKGAGYMSGKIKRLCGGDFSHWNANLRGVDLNHNFSAGWDELRALEKKEGIYGPAPTRFGGFSPESEPETIALTELCRRVNIRHVVALHTQGECIYWTWGNHQPAHSAKMAEILAAESGFALEYPTGLAVGGGFKDWFIEEFDRPGFTIELGRGKNPLPTESFYSILTSALPILTLAAIM